MSQGRARRRAWILSSWTFCQVSACWGHWIGMYLVHNLCLICLFPFLSHSTHPSTARTKTLYFNSISPAQSFTGNFPSAMANMEFIGWVFIIIGLSSIVHTCYLKRQTRQDRREHRRAGSLNHISGKVLTILHLGGRFVALYLADLSRAILTPLDLSPSSPPTPTGCSCLDACFLCRYGHDAL